MNKWKKKRQEKIYFEVHVIYENHISFKFLTCNEVFLGVERILDWKHPPSPKKKLIIIVDLIDFEQKQNYPSIMS